MGKHKGRIECRIGTCTYSGRSDNVKRHQRLVHNTRCVRSKSEPTPIRIEGASLKVKFPITPLEFNMSSEALKQPTFNQT